MAVDDAYTKSLLHFNGDDNGTDFTDESGKVWTRTGTPVTDQDLKKFGSAAGAFASGDSITTPNHADFDLSTIDFTIDFWVRFANITDNTCGLVGLCDNGYLASSGIMMGYAQGGGYLGLFVSQNGVTWDIQDVDAWTAAYSADTWYHLALVRNGNDLYTYLDGTKINTYDVTGYDIFYGAGDFYINKCSGGFAVQIEEFRFSSGIARWTGASFSVPTGEYVPTTPTVVTCVPLELGVSGVASHPSVLIDTSVAPLDLPVSGTAQIITASVNCTPLDLTISGTAEVIVGIYGDVTLPCLEVSGTLICLSNAGDVHLPGLTVSGHCLTGEVGSGNPHRLKLPVPVIRGYTGSVGDCQLPTLTVNATGLTGTILKADDDNIQLTLLTVAGTGLVQGFHRGNIVLPGLHVNGTHTQHGICSGSIVLPALRMEGGHGVSGNYSHGSIVLPILGITATGYENARCTGDIELPALLVHASGRNIPISVTYKGVMLNLAQAGVTELSDLNFNSLAELNGHILGANSQGIFIMAGNKDSGSDIAAQALTGVLDCGTPIHQLVRDVWMTYRSTGGMTFKVSVDESGLYSMSFTGNPVIHEERVKVPRGLKGRFYQFGVANVDGSEFDINSLSILVHPVARRSR